MATNDDLADDTGASRKTGQDLPLDDEFGLEPQQAADAGMPKKAAVKPVAGRASAGQPTAEVFS